MMENLNSSAALAKYTSQFVTVKMSTSDKEWQKFHSDFKGDYKGSISVPFVYIIRSDGTTMYTGSGMMEVEEMGQVLHKTLGQSGKFLSEKDLYTLVETKKKVEELIEAEDAKGAVAALKKVLKMGPVGQIPSYAKAATEMNVVAGQLVSDGQAAVVPILEKMQTMTSEDSNSEVSESDRVELLSSYLETSDSYAALKPLKPAFAKIKKLIKKDDDFDALLKDLRTIDRAQAAKTKTPIEKALVKLEGIMEKRTSGPIFDKASSAAEELKKKLEK